MQKNVRGFIVAALMAGISSLAWATQPGNNGGGNGGCGTGQQTNGCTAEGGQGGAGGAGVGVGIGVGVGLGGAGGVGYGGAGGLGGAGGQGGAGGKGGEGGNATVLGSGNSSNSNINANLQGQQQGQGQLQGQGQQQSNTSANSNAVTGYGGNATGNGAGNVTTIDVAAPVIPKPASNTAYAPDIPTTAKSCRLFIGMGGTSRDGSGSGLVPIGNDQTCLSVTAVQLMIEINTAQRRGSQPAPFGTADILSAACKIEGMKDTIAACKQ